MLQVSVTSLPGPFLRTLLLALLLDAEHLATEMVGERSMRKLRIWLVWTQEKLTTSEIL